VNQPVQIGDRAQMRKPHPCGSNVWTVFRVGMDIGLRCEGCGRRVLMNRAQFNRQLRALLSADHPPGDVNLS
jgi:hypothetical protein